MNNSQPDAVFPLSLEQVLKMDGEQPNNIRIPLLFLIRDHCCRLTMWERPCDSDEILPIFCIL